MDLEQRKRYTRWHSRGVPAHWLVTDDAHTYRTARNTDPISGERLVLMAESDLLAEGLEPDPPRDVPSAVHPHA